MDRKANGQFQRGTSGNPGGRPKEVVEVRELARERTTKAIEALEAILDDDKQPGSTKVAAATALLDRGHGRPGASVDMKVQNGPSLVDVLMDVGTGSISASSSGSWIFCAACFSTR